MADENDFRQPHPIIGTPLSDSAYFPGRQSYDDTCAIRCQEFIIRQYTGVSAPEKFFVDEARAHGWYAEGRGTPPADIGKLLELHGIPVHRYFDAHPFQLAGELYQGHKVIIGVDSNELLRNNQILRDIGHLFDFGTADHAVVVSGIDTSDREHVQVILSDPATGDALARYPLDQFVHAWKGSHFFMVATQDPPPEELHLPEMSHFDYRAGHVEHIDNLAQELQELVDPDDHAHHPHHYDEHPLQHVAHADDFHHHVDDHDPDVDHEFDVDPEFDAGGGPFDE